ncbi:hypothetical protein XELAEV_18020867mg [Xenopus laevis]|uniref:RING-type domain-containing protein n=1 Tax=Xenopus laevis TaxID=8355 RepID=A0A974DAF1_XENLA|nr:hypothetical protein XELAEV_18020867mg [Xenopus laevis]
MEGSTTCFSSISDFCSDCGSVLPTPGIEDTVTCLRCSHRICYCCVQKLDTIILSNETEDSREEIDRRCSRCGFERMAYHTR